MIDRQRAYVIGAWLLVIAQGAIAAYAAARIGWFAAGVAAGFAAVSATLLHWHAGVPAWIRLLVVAAMVLNAVGWVWEVYKPVWGYDEVAHSFTSFVLTLYAGFLIARSVLPELRGRGVLLAMLATCVGIATGALWEVFEFVASINESRANSVGDLVADAIGAAAGGVLAVRVAKHHAHRQAPESAGAAPPSPGH